MTDFPAHLTEYVIGAFGAGVRVLIGHDKGEPQSKARMFATVIAGSVLAGTSSQALTEYADLPVGFAGGIAFLIGMLAIGFLYQALEGKVADVIWGRLRK